MMFKSGNTAFNKPSYSNGFLKLDGPQFYNYGIGGYKKLPNGDLVPKDYPEGDSEKKDMKVAKK